MKVVILLHSATGNTRLVTRYVAAQLERQGHDCQVHDIARRRPLPELADADLLGLACPTNYFRPTFAMEQAVSQLPRRSGPPLPAFLLGTCAGAPGAHYALLAEQLAQRGYQARAAHWVVAPTNWPPQLRVVAPLQLAGGLGPLLARHSRRLRPLWGLVWPAACVPDEGDREQLDRFIEGLVQQSQLGWPGPPPTHQELHRPLPTLEAQGRAMRLSMVPALLKLRIDASRCSACGTCVALCPSGCLTQQEGQPPRVTEGCTGCYACYNHCPDSAIHARGAPGGRGRYAGPPAAMRSLFASYRRR